MFKNFIFQFAICFFGCLIGYRMLGRAEKMSLIESEQKKKIFFILMIVISAFSLVSTPKIFLPACLILFLLPLLLMWGIELLRRAQFEKAVVEILDLSVLRMKSGLSFRQSVSESIYSLPLQLRFYFLELMSHLEVQKVGSEAHLRPCEREFLKIILSVNDSMTRQIEKLGHFRANEKMKNHFRLKSRQMTVQVRIQAVILFILYLVLAIYQLFHHPQIVRLGYFWISVAAMIIGSVLYFILPRRFRWKV